MRRILKGAEEKVSRKVSVQGNLVHLINHTVRRNINSSMLSLFDRITISYPDGENTPPYILERAAKCDWIVVQDRMRKKLNESDWEMMEGLTVDAKDINGSLGVEGREAADPIVKARNMLEKMSQEQRDQLMELLQQ